MTERYFVLLGSEDGEPSFHQKTLTEVLQLLLGDEGEDNGYTAVKDLPDDLQNFGGDEMVIIKGEIIVPKPKKVVTEYDL